MDHAFASPQLIEAIVCLSIVAVVTAAFRRSGVPPALGLLAAGVCIGPAGFAISGRDGVVAWASELGLLFLLFIVGLELSVDRIRTMAKLVFRYGLLHFVFSSALIGGLAYAAGMGSAAAAVLGMALAMSSTAFVSEVLRERGWMQLSRGRRVLGGLLFQDIAVGPIFAVLPLIGMAQGAHAPVVPHAVGAVALVLLFLVARLILGAAVGAAREGGRNDAFPAAVIAAALAMGGAAEALGMSPGVGALLAGVALAGVEWRHDVKKVVEPFKATLLAFVFIGIGMAMPIDAGPERLAWMAAAGVGLMLAKTVTGALAGLLCGQKLRPALGVAMVLSQAGEFSFLVLALAAKGGGIAPGVVDFWIGAAVVSMVFTPLAMRLAERVMGTPPERVNAPAKSDATVPAPAPAD